MNKHTPGPWTVDDIFPLTVKSGKTRVALVYDHNGPAGTRICKANARLIKAAPLMLEAAYEASSLLDDIANKLGGMLDKYHLDTLPARAALERAIAAAEGE